MAVEILAVYIRKAPQISGIILNDRPIKLISYADDTSAVLPNKEEAREFIKIVKKFGKFSGLKMNTEKSEALWLGIDRNSADKPLGVKWPKAIKILGVYISYNDNISIDKGFQERIINMKQKLSQRKK